jgi:hypothetical protein
VIISVIFQYVVADIILYFDSIDSAETVKFWPRTSSQCGNLQGGLVPSNTQAGPNDEVAGPILFRF